MSLSLFGAILAIPAAIYSGACATGLSTLGDGATKLFTDDAGIRFLLIGLNSALIGLASAFLHKKNPKPWGAMMLFAGILSGVTLTTFNFLSFAVCILFLIGGVISLTQNRSVL